MSCADRYKADISTNLKSKSSSLVQSIGAGEQSKALDPRGEEENLLLNSKVCVCLVSALLQVGHQFEEAVPGDEPCIHTGTITALKL